MRSRKDTHLKFRVHYSSHVVFHTVRAGVYAKKDKFTHAYFLRKQKSTEEQSWKKQPRLSSETAAKLEQLRNVQRIKALLAKNVKLLFLC